MKNTLVFVFHALKIVIKYFHGEKKYGKISSIFQCNWHNTNIGRKPCKWLDVYFSGKEPNFFVKYRFEKECHFKNKFGVFLKTLPLAKRLAMATLLAFLQGKWENKKCLPKQLEKQLVQTQFA